MASIKDRFIKWKENRSTWQKVGDILFWVLIILFLIPGPRKAILTTLNRVVLNVKVPRTMAAEKQQMLTDLDYNWLLAWDQNEPYYFSNTRDEVVFLSFWATWCPPCVAELPEIQSLYDRWGDKVVFMLVTNESPEVVKPFMEKNDYLMPVFYLAGSPPPDPLAFKAFPTTFIISSDGHVVSRKTGAANWDSRATDRIFEELLK
jgi:thiol-disulfide isomerase/thioredoxin